MLTFFVVLGIVLMSAVVLVIGIPCLLLISEYVFDTLEQKLIERRKRK